MGYKGTIVEGDVSVGHNAHVGGKVKVEGCVYVGRDLRVFGWLDAPNIKGPSKGLFKTEAQLLATYPKPQNGWWALVATPKTSDHLGQLYIAEGGQWVAQVDGQGEPILKGSPVLDSEGIMQDVQRINEAIEAAKKESAEKIESVKRDVTTAKTNVEKLEGSKGKADGIAPLDETSHIPSVYLPVSAFNVLEFAGVVESVAFEESSSSNKSTDATCDVVYNSTTKTFALRLIGARPAYFSNWADGYLYGENSDNGRIPQSGKIYIDTTNNKSFRWNGIKLEPIGSALELGHNEGNAFPGNEGAKLQTQIADVRNLLTARFHGIVEDAESKEISVTNVSGVYYISSKKIFAGKSGGNYVNNWTGADAYMTEDRSAILKDKVYLLGAAAFVWSDEEQTLVDVTDKVKDLVTAQGERITTLQGALSTLQGALSTLQQSVTSEVTARDDADKELEKKIEEAKKEAKKEANTSADLALVYSINRASASFEGFVDNVSLAGTFDKTITPKVYFDRIRKTFVGKDNGGVYILLIDLEGDIKTAVNAAPFIIGGEIVKDKIYKCKDKLYCWDDAANNLVQMGNDGGLKIVMHNADEHTFVLTPDALHVWPEVTQLHLTFAAAEDGYVGEYAFQFTCPEDAGTTLELPAGIKWYGGKVVVPEAGKTYQASVVNDVIIMGGADEFV